MTDEMIIEMAENCMSESPSCVICPYDEGTYTSSECMGKLIKDLLNLTNRLRAENDELKQELFRLKSGIRNLIKELGGE